MTKQSTADNLADLVRLFGGTVTGRETTAKLLDKLEGVAPQGGGTPSQDAMAQAVEHYIETHTGGLTEEEVDEIFGVPYVPGGESGGIETGGLTDEEIDDLFNG